MSRKERRERQPAEKEKRSAVKKASSPEEIIRKRRRRLADRAEIRSFFTRLTALIVILALAFTLVLGITPVRNDDMLPKLSAGDLVLYYRLEQEFISGDVVVYEADGQEYIGRIVGRGGDEVEITDAAELKVNGSIMAETEIYYSTPRYDTAVEYPITLGTDEYFLLSDYRPGGKDSRYFGAVKRSEIKGVLIAALRREGL